MTIQFRKRMKERYVARACIVEDFSRLMKVTSPIDLFAVDNTDCVPLRLLFITSIVLRDCSRR